MPCRRVGNCCCNASPTTKNLWQNGDQTLHDGRRLPRKPSSSLQTVAITFMIWSWAPVTS